MSLKVVEAILSEYCKQVDDGYTKHADRFIEEYAEHLGDWFYVEDPIGFDEPFGQRPRDLKNGRYVYEFLLNRHSIEVDPAFLYPSSVETCRHIGRMYAALALSTQCRFRAERYPYGNTFSCITYQTAFYHPISE